jgi:hypothetical protein
MPIIRKKRSYRVRLADYYPAGVKALDPDSYLVRKRYFVSSFNFGSDMPYINFQLGLTECFEDALKLDKKEATLISWRLPFSTFIEGC